MINIHDVYAAVLSGVAKYKNEKEIWWEEPITVEIIDSENYILRAYYSTNNQLFYEQHYKNNVKNGIYKEWFYGGPKCAEINYKDGKLHGRHLVWHTNGILHSEINYKNGVIHGTCSMWAYDGGCTGKSDWENGKPIKNS